MIKKVEVFMVAAHSRGNTIFEQVKYCPRYGVFTTDEDCQKKVDALNKRSLRGNIYFVIPLLVNEPIENSLEIACSGSRTRKKKKVA
jgi:hypothetical protein